MKETIPRESNTRPLCCIIFLFNLSDRRVVHRSCPIGSRLGILRGQDGKWRKSGRERHDRCSSNSSIWNAGAHNPPAQWSVGGRTDQRPRTICARPGHRRDTSSSPRVRLLGSSARDACRHRPPRLIAASTVQPPRLEIRHRFLAACGLRSIHQCVVSRIAMRVMAASVRTINNGLNSGSGTYLFLIRHPRKVFASVL